MNPTTEKPQQPTRPTPLQEPIIYDYSDYRHFLKDYYLAQKAKSRVFSFRYFSRKAGYSSPGLLKMVMEGRRNLTPESILNFARAMRLAVQETSFFANLVGFTQSQTTEEKQYYAGEMLRSKGFRRARPQIQAKLEYWSRWYHVAIRELVAMPLFNEDPRWISTQLVPPIPPQDAATALQKLEEWGLIRRDETGRLVQTEQAITTGDELTSTFLRQFHRDMIQRGRDCMERFAQSERQVSSVTVGVSEASEARIREKINAFRKEVLDIIREETTPNRVCQINLQFFPLSERAKS